MTQIDEHAWAQKFRAGAWWAMVGVMLLTILSTGYTLNSEQAARHEADEKLHLATQGSEAGYYFWQVSSDSVASLTAGGNGDGDDYVWYSKQFCSNLGCDTITPTLRSFLDLLHPDDLPVVRNAVKAWYGSRGKRPYEAEYRLRGADGVYRWFVARGAGNFDASPVTLAGSVMPINEVKRQQMRLSRIVDSTPVALIMCDGSGKITAYNPAAEELFGWKASEVLGKQQAHFMLLPPYREQHDEMMEKAKERLRASGEPWQITRRHVFGEVRRKDGKQLQVELTIRGIAYDGVIEFIASIRDRYAPDNESRKFDKLEPSSSLRLP